MSPPTTTAAEPSRAVELERDRSLGRGGLLAAEGDDFLGPLVLRGPQATTVSKTPATRCRAVSARVVDRQDLAGLAGPGQHHGVWCPPTRVRNRMCRSHSSSHRAVRAGQVQSVVFTGDRANEFEIGGDHVPVVAAPGESLGEGRGRR